MLSTTGTLYSGMGFNRSPKYLSRWCNGSAHSNALGQRKHTLSDVFNCGRILRLHRDKSIGDHVTEEQGGPGPLTKIGPFFRPNEFFPIYRAQFVERGKNFIRQ